MEKPNYTNPILITASFIIIIAGVMYAAAIIAQLLMALFVSIVCAHPIAWMKKRKVPQGIAILIVFIGILGLFFGLGGLIANSLSSFSQSASQYEKNLSDIGASLLAYIRSFGLEVSKDKMSALFDPSKTMSFTASILSQLGGFMSNALTIFFLVLFLLMELDSISTKTKAVIAGTTLSFSYLNVIATNIRHYLSIKTLTSLLTGVCIWIGLAIIDLDYAIIWALIAFLLNYIPNIGSIIAALPAVLFSIVQLGLGGMVGTMLVFIMINLIIGNVVEPKMMGQGLGLSTFVVFFALLFWGFVLGTVGMFLSVPLTMAIKIVLDQYPSTKPVAIFLGTHREAQLILDEKNQERKEHL